MRKLLGIFAFFWATDAAADYQYWDYKDWTVAVERVDTGEDLRITCTASTGGDGDPSLAITLSNGDAAPPYFYPGPELLERAPRGYTTMMTDGARVMFEFDVDWRTEGFVTAGYDAEGFAQAIARAHQNDSLGLLQTMRRAGMLWITLDGEVVYAASLSGFTAAYGKMAEQCGFPTVGVID
ncbi:hypothetical protein ACOTTU_07960 [Roseobacter sp. EG26]|uniref:hypothetical protein n=1 Tax=Roseobacter sp. EG26 TaxID=3412477 RepID=UPI003CE4F2B0